jgi:Mrp family chromosome partitioning ATPase
MSQKMDKRVVGVVGNMSYFYVPEIDKKIELFGKSCGGEMAKAAHAPHSWCKQRCQRSGY